MNNKKQAKTNKIFSPATEYSTIFKITENTLEKFANLTGDYSSLHTDKAFARKSLYREKVVHGFLPLMFISVLKFEAGKDNILSIKEISANFIKPIFINQKLSLEAKSKGQKTNSNGIEFEYNVKNIESGAVLIMGMFVLNHPSIKEEGTGALNNKPLKSAATMLSAPLVEKDLSFDEIFKNDKQVFQFAVSLDCESYFYEILNSGILDDYKSDFLRSKSNFNSQNLLASSLLSTFAGMCIPGRQATILNFKIAFNENVILNDPYSFEGEVIFKSSADTISEEILIYRGNNRAQLSGRGKINIKINKKSVSMLDIASLREKFLDLQLKGKVVLITGASRGIGETTAKLFTLQGSKVVINYLRGEQDALRIVKEINDHGGDAMAVQADVSKNEEVQKMIKTVVKKHNIVDVLVNNAVRNFHPINFMELTWDEIQKDIDVTVKGSFNCCKEVIPLMLKNGGGRIINISSIATDNPPLNHTKYVISKSGLEGLTRSLALEFASENILVNTVVPNIVDTDLTAGISKAFFSVIANDIPVKRIASAVDVARTVVYLASSLSSYITGQRIMVTGGSLPLL